MKFCCWIFLLWILLDIHDNMSWWVEEERICVEKKSSDEREWVTCWWEKTWSCAECCKVFGEERWFEKLCVLERKVAFERRVEKLLLSERVLESSKGEEERKTGLNHSLLRLEVWSVVPAPDPDPAPHPRAIAHTSLPSFSLSFPSRSLSFLALFNRVASAWTLEP